LAGRPDLSTENASVAVLCRFYRPAAERRGNMAVATPLAAAMCNDPLTLPMLTYISIGFVSNLIYAEENFGADHNMLLIGRVWAHRDCQSRNWPGRAAGSRYTFVLSPQSVAIVSRSANRHGCRSEQVFPGVTSGGGRGIAKERVPGDARSRMRRNKDLPGFTTNHIIPAKRFVRLGRCLVVRREAAGWGAGHRLR
jgi:hypothetical protein